MLIIMLRTIISQLFNFNPTDKKKVEKPFLYYCRCYLGVTRKVSQRATTLIVVSLNIHISLVQLLSIIRAIVMCGHEIEI